MIKNNITRCQGGNCPSKTNCKRHTLPIYENSVFGALYVRREAGANACDMVIWVKPQTTFEGA